MRARDTAPKHLRIARMILREIEGGRYRPGTPLPSEATLAARFGVARGTIHRALQDVEESHRRVSRRGARWYVHEAPRMQDVTELRSFGQWALATGLRPGGRTVRSVEGRATAEEARELGVADRAPVLRITRVQTLDDVPAMVKRTTYPAWLIPLLSTLPEDARSIMEVVEREGGPGLAHGEHRISAMAATPEDARLLESPSATPLLRVERTVRTVDARPFELSDDRYLGTVTAFSLVNAAPGQWRRGRDRARTA
ncbi:GntR family transcriptional regulator [Microbacterium resistens]